MAEALSDVSIDLLRVKQTDTLADVDALAEEDNKEERVRAYSKEGLVRPLAEAFALVSAVGVHVNAPESVIDLAQLPDIDAHDEVVAVASITEGVRAIVGHAEAEFAALIVKPAEFVERGLVDCALKRERLASCETVRSAPLSVEAELILA